MSKVERAFLVERLFKSKSYIAVQAVLWQKFNQVPPCRKIIQQTVTKYRSHGTSLNRNKENFGRRMTARSDVNIELVRNILENNSIT